MICNFLFYYFIIILIAIVHSPLDSIKTYLDQICYYDLLEDDDDDDDDDDDGDDDYLRRVGRNGDNGRLASN